MQDFFKINSTDLRAGIYVCATPIGNLGDITLRAIEILKLADFIICEDNFMSMKLLKALDIKKKLITYNDHSDENTRQKIFELILQNQKAALISDAGTPLISDPGYKLINEAIKKKIEVFTIPGPCSAIAALSISGIESDRFVFLGFLSPKSGKRKQDLEKFGNLESSLIIFATARNLIKDLQEIKEILGNRNIAVGRELTKIYEELKYGTIDEIITYYQNNVLKGEIVLIISGKGESKNEDDAIKIMIRNMMDTHKLKEIANIIGQKFNLTKKQAYEKALEVKNQS